MITRIGGDGSLVNPTGMALDRRGALIITDQGESRVENPMRNWRAQPHEFGVVVLFSRQRPIDDLMVRNRARQAIAETLAAHQPAHGAGWLHY